VPLDPSTITMAGGTQPHANVQPFQAINYIIAMDGDFPGGGGGGPDYPFVGEIRFFPYSFAPRAWAPCRGQLLPPSQNTALFSILRAYYGGDGRSTFALPNLQAATPIGTGQGPGLSDRSLGASGGQDKVPLTEANLPSHSHRLTASAAPGTTTGPANQLPAMAPNLAIYGPAANMQPMSKAAILAQGGGAPHNNLQPYLALNPCIALQGMYPPHP
jgi:microcystin-dependent protein